MSEYTIDAESDAVTLAAGDEWDVFQASSGRIKKTNVGELIAASGGTVAVTAGAVTLTLTQAVNGNKVHTLANTAPIAITLPAATGTGVSYKFLVTQAATATASTILCAGSDKMSGMAIALTTASANIVGYAASAGAATSISLNGTTKGGVAGDWIEITDCKAGLWYASLITQPSGTTATPFS